MNKVDLYLDITNLGKKLVDNDEAVVLAWKNEAPVFFASNLSKEKLAVFLLTFLSIPKVHEVYLEVVKDILNSEQYDTDEQNTK